MAVPQLSETHSNQLLNQIKELNYYDGTPGRLSGFVNQVEQLLNLYPTQDARQAHVIYGAVKRLLVDSALQVVTQERTNTWLETKKALAMAFKDHRPYITLIRQLEDTSYPGSICKFIEKLERQYWIMFDKLELEDDPVDKSNYTEMLNRTVKSVIDRKLPDRIYMSLARKDIDTIYKLKQASMELGFYDASPENFRPNRSKGNKRRNRGNYNQKNNQKYYSNRNHNYNNHYPGMNQNNNTQPPQNSNQFIPNQNQIFLSSVEIYSKFASLVEVKSRDWLEAKRVITKICKDMGKPKEIKADKDSAFMFIALQNWLRSEGVEISVTTSKNGVSDIERFHKTVNEKESLETNKILKIGVQNLEEFYTYIITKPNIILLINIQRTFFYMQAAQILMYNKTKLIR
nr:uncharacterized protein LOC120284711 [Drosophila simulans]